jgi:hypothetical protein
MFFFSGWLMTIQSQLALPPEIGAAARSGVILS